MSLWLYLSYYIKLSNQMLKGDGLQDCASTVVLKLVSLLFIKFYRFRDAQWVRYISWWFQLPVGSSICEKKTKGNDDQYLLFVLNCALNFDDKQLCYPSFLFVCVCVCVCVCVFLSVYAFQLQGCIFFFTLVLGSFTVTINIYLRKLLITF